VTMTSQLPDGDHPSSIRRQPDGLGSAGLMHERRR
jgi:hypothetical protein